MIIYPSTKVLPYVYLLTHKITGQFYIGVRYANKVPSSEDLGNSYFTSSKYVKELGFENFELTIIAEFFTKDFALEFEAQIIKENWKYYSIKLINKNYSGSILFNNNGKKFSNEIKQNMSKAQRGKIRSEEAKKNYSDSMKSRFLQDPENLIFNRLGLNNQKNYILKTPVGEIIIIKSLRHFCQNNNLNDKTLKSAFLKNSKVIRGPSAGWQILVIL